MDRFCVLAFVYDAMHAPQSVPCLRAIGTVYVPTLGIIGGGAPEREPHRIEEVTYKHSSVGGGVRTVGVDVELRVVALPA